MLGLALNMNSLPKLRYFRLNIQAMQLLLQDFFSFSFTVYQVGMGFWMVERAYPVQ